MKIENLNWICCNGKLQPNFEDLLPKNPQNSLDTVYNKVLLKLKNK